MHFVIRFAIIYYLTIFSREKSTTHSAEMNVRRRKLYGNGHAETRVTSLHSLLQMQVDPSSVPASSRLFDSSFLDRPVHEAGAFVHCSPPSAAHIYPAFIRPILSFQPGNSCQPRSRECHARHTRLFICNYMRSITTRPGELTCRLRIYVYAVYRRRRICTHQTDVWMNE